jgi:hypothetical protein
MFPIKSFIGPLSILYIHSENPDRWSGVIFNSSKRQTGTVDTGPEIPIEQKAHRVVYVPMGPIVKE